MLHPHVPEELKHFGKHLFATFLGLLMALGLEQWREHHHEAKQASLALATVEAELRSDLARVDQESRRCEQSLRNAEALDTYLAALIAAKREGKALLALEEPPTMGIALNFSTDAWETFKGLGALRHVAPDRAQRLSKAYLRLGVMQQHLESHPVLRQIPASLFLLMEQPERFRNLDLARLEQAREGVQLMALVFRWTRHEIDFIREGCEAALKP
jgi:hypothetical protein